MMIMIPIAAGVIALAAILLALFNIFGVSYINLLGEPEHIGEMVEQVQLFSVKWSRDIGPETIQNDMDRMKIILSGKEYSGISLTVYRDGERLYTAGEYVETPFLNYALSEPGNNQYLKNRIYTYTADAGEYKIILTDTDFWFSGGTYTVSRWVYIERYLVLVLVMILIITLVSLWILSNKVLKSIMKPLNILVEGVHQIRDGNLEFRIKYENKDEFQAVCADFNDMAERLLDMVNTRQKDEENRKELIAGISHDLRTPLTSILTYAEGIEIGLASTPQIQRGYLDTIKRKAKEVEHIVSQLFLLAKLDIDDFPMRMQQIDIGSWLADFVDNVSEEYGRKGLRVELTENIQGVPISADSIQLGNVFTNMIDNSLKYIDKDKKTAQFICREVSGNVIVSVSDNGPGVPDDELDRLFQMFYRSDKARSDMSQGSGLGLSIAAKIIERFGGTIEAENIAGGGLSVTVTLPVAKGAEQS